MADVKCWTSSTAFLPFTAITQAHSIHLQKQIPLCASLSANHLLKRIQCGQTALKPRLGDSSPTSFSGAASKSCKRQRHEGRDAADASITSASRDASGSSGTDDDNHEFRYSPQDGFGLYPWDPAWQALDLDDLEWIQEERVTLFTSEGIVKLGGSRSIAPRASYNERKYGSLRALSRLRRYREDDYMDPKQGLCLGAIFDIAATNGLDTRRRFCVFGFCRSIEMLSDVVEDTVLGQGGEVVIAEKGSTTGLHEKLNMTVAMPALWGVPPAFDVLNSAIRSGGGIVEKTYRKWEFL